MFLLWSRSHPPDMSPHILSVLTSITQPPRSALLTPVLIPCVCQIKRPRPEWFSHVSSSVFTFPTHTSRNVIWQQKFCFFIYSHTLHPSSLHLILLFTCKPPSPFDVAVTSHECFWNLREANSHFHWFPGCCNDLLRIGHIVYLFTLMGVLGCNPHTLWICLQGLIESNHDLKISERCSSVVPRSPKAEVPKLSRACSQQVGEVRW